MVNTIFDYTFYLWRVRRSVKQTLSPFHLLLLNYCLGFSLIFKIAAMYAISQENLKFMHYHLTTFLFQNPIKMKINLKKWWSRARQIFLPRILIRCINPIIKRSHSTCLGCFCFSFKNGFAASSSRYSLQQEQKDSHRWHAGCALVQQHSCLE